MDDLDLLAALDVDPTVLAAAPEQPTTADARGRFGLPCMACGAPGVATTTVTVPAGRYWLDSCRTHMIAAARLRSGEPAA